MSARVVEFHAAEMSDWDTFHDSFAKKFNFPDYYGRNMNAWIDCMSSLHNPVEKLTEFDAPVDAGVLVISLRNAEQLRVENREIWEALNECAAFVNFRRMEAGEPPALALAYHV